MMLSTKLLEAAGNAATTPVYVEDVFSTYLFTGTGGTLTLQNGLKNDYLDVVTSVTIPPSTSTDGTSLSYLLNTVSSDSGAPQISADSHVTNGRSVNFAQGSGYRPASASANFAYGTGDFCIELWVKRTADLGGRVFTHDDNAINLDMGSGGELSTYQVGSLSATTGAVPLNSWTHIALTRASGTARLFINGSQVSSGSAPNNYSANRRIHIGVNNGFSSDSFPGLIGHVRVYKGSAKYTGNFTPSTSFSADTNVVFLVAYNSSTSFLSDTLTSQSINKHVMSWGKPRDNGNYHALSDTLRGGAYGLVPNSTEAQRYSPSGQYIKRLTADGIVLGSEGDINGSGNSMVNWAFRQAPKFFDVVTYTGDGSAPRNIAHNLGSTPGCIIVKSTSSATNWAVYHRSLGATQLIRLNRDWASESSFQNWADTSPTSTQFTVGADGSVNASGQTYVAYLFAHNAGGFGLNGTDNVISCGTFTTDGSGNATVNLGYEPQWILTKQSNAVNSWGIYDTMRGWSRGEQRYLLPDMSMAEGVINATNFVPTATGFTTSSPYASSAPYIYIAIRKGPMKVPTDATTVFKPVYATTPSSPYTVTTNFPVDLSISTIVNGAYNRAVVDRLRGMNSANQNRYIVTNGDSAESSSLAGYYLSFQSNTSITDIQFWSGYSLSPVYWNFRRAPSFFDQVCYTGTGAALTLNHNLGVAPELIITKSRSQGSGYNWNTWCTGLTNNQYLNLNLASSVQTYSGIFGGSSTVATATTFNVSNSPTANNDSGQTFVAYLFATCPGVSKVGSYTGTGSSLTIDCGFTSGARFVMIKCTTQAYDWMVFDTARGINSATEPFLVINSNNAQNTISSGSIYDLDWIDPHSTGFTLPSSYGYVNASGETYIYLAIA